MIIGVPRETYPGESRVALVPAVVAGLVAAGPEVAVESTAGLKAGFADAEYEAEGARLVARRPDLFAEADILLQVRGQGANLEAGSADLELLRPGQVVLGLLNPLGEPQAMSKLAETGVTALALELLPRTSRAQSMDALSSMGTIAGYKAVLLAASALPKMFPMMMTAAGTVRPAHAFVVGAGVAGLQAIATARRLGAVVEAYDVRPAVKEQVESLGAKFVTLSFEAEEAEGAGGYARAMGEEFYRRQREMMTSVVAQSDVIITTAAVPGTRAPVLITGEMVREMKAGSVIVDLAAETGGNCDLTRPGETVEIDGVAVMGPVNVPSTVPQHASQMYARNLVAFLEVLVKDGQLQVDMDDPHISETLVAHRGEVVNPRVLELLQRSDAPASAEGREYA